MKIFVVVKQLDEKFTNVWVGTSHEKAQEVGMNIYHYDPNDNIELQTWLEGEIVTIEEIYRDEWTVVYG